MGEILKARCGNCGYTSKNIGFGGGRINFKTYCGYPVLNIDTNEIETRNYFEKESIIKNSDNIIFYDSDSLINRDLVDKKNFHQWGDVHIFRGQVYRCPKCKEFKLAFISVGLYD